MLSDGYGYDVRRWVEAPSTGPTFPVFPIGPIFPYPLPPLVGMFGAGIALHAPFVQDGQTCGPERR